MLSNWAELYAKLIDLTGLIFRNLFCHKEFCIFLPRRWVRLFFCPGGLGCLGKMGWLGKDAWPSIQLSKSAAAAGKAGATRGTKDDPLYKGATCVFESKKVLTTKARRH
jgi:hypothetical protein